MKKITAIISLASWEPRFILGIEKILSKYQNPKIIIIFYIKEYAHITSVAREKVKNRSAELGIELIEKELTFDKPDESWKTIFDVIYQEHYDLKNTLLDITTMPREIIWIILRLLIEKKYKIFYVYTSPQSYNNEWLSRDPKIPRLVYKLSGISKLGKNTILVLITGFDLERSKQIIKHFEPEITLVGIQQGTQFNNQKLNIDRHMSEFSPRQSFKLFEINAYSPDHGLSTIEEQVDPYLKDANVILSSLGPKLSSISLFNYHIKHPEVGLIYAPSGEFNINYSIGIGKTYFGEI
jgi:hypothetical protein